MKTLLIGIVVLLVVIYEYSTTDQLSKMPDDVNYGLPSSIGYELPKNTSFEHVYDEDGYYVMDGTFCIEYIPNSEDTKVAPLFKKYKKNMQSQRDRLKRMKRAMIEMREELEKFEKKNGTYDAADYEYIKKHENIIIDDINNIAFDELDENLKAVEGLPNYK